MPRPASGAKASPSLRMGEVGRRSQEREARLAAPERPVVAAADEEEAVRDAEAGELRREGAILLAEQVGRPGVEPDVRVRAAKLRRDGVERLRRAVAGQHLRVAAEDRAEVVGLLVARPALEHLELAGVVQADVECAVAPLGEAAERPAGTG